MTFAQFCIYTSAKTIHDKQPAKTLALDLNSIKTTCNSITKMKTGKRIVEILKCQLCAACVRFSHYCTICMIVDMLHASVTGFMQTNNSLNLLFVVFFWCFALDDTLPSFISTDPFSSPKTLGRSKGTANPFFPTFLSSELRELSLCVYIYGLNFHCLLLLIHFE